MFFSVLRFVSNSTAFFEMLATMHEGRILDTSRYAGRMFTICKRITTFSIAHGLLDLLAPASLHSWKHINKNHQQCHRCRRTSDFTKATQKLQASAVQILCKAGALARQMGDTGSCMEEEMLPWVISKLLSRINAPGVHAIASWFSPLRIIMSQGKIICNFTMYISCEQVRTS